jgi:hypothetical protein
LGQGLLEQCARAGCLVNLALELRSAASTGIGPWGALGCAESGGGGGGGGGGLALDWYAAGAADFLLLQQHFVGWAAAARAGALQERRPLSRLVDTVEPVE